MCDFLWSDPEDIDDWENNPRGAGVIFGVKVVDKFLKTSYITFNAAPEDYKPAPEKKPLPEYFL